MDGGLIGKASVLFQQTGNVPRFSASLRIRPFPQFHAYSKQCYTGPSLFHPVPFLFLRRLRFCRHPAGAQHRAAVPVFRCALGYFRPAGLRMAAGARHLISERTPDKECISCFPVSGRGWQRPAHVWADADRRGRLVGHHGDGTAVSHVFRSALRHGAQALVARVGIFVWRGGGHRPRHSAPFRCCCGGREHDRCARGVDGLPLLGVWLVAVSPGIVASQSLDGGGAANASCRTDAARRFRRIRRVARFSNRLRCLGRVTRCSPTWWFL